MRTLFDMSRRIEVEQLAPAGSGYTEALLDTINHRGFLNMFAPESTASHYTPEALYIDETQIEDYKTDEQYRRPEIPDPASFPFAYNWLETLHEDRYRSYQDAYDQVYHDTADATTEELLDEVEDPEMHDSLAFTLATTSALVGGNIGVAAGIYLLPEYASALALFGAASSAASSLHHSRDEYRKLVSRNNARKDRYEEKKAENLAEQLNTRTPYALDSSIIQQLKQPDIPPHSYRAWHHIEV